MIQTMTIQGLLMGHGTPYTIVRARGFESPNLDVSRYKRTATHGARILRSLWRERIMRMEIRLRAPTKAEYASLRNDLLSALDLPRAGNVTMYFTTTDGRSLQAEGVNLNAPHDGDFLPGHVTTGGIAIELVTGDTMFYGQDLFTQNISPPVAGGVTLPTVLPFPFSASGGSETIVNAGIAPHSPILRIYGPGNNAHLRNSTTGEEFSIQNNIPTGQYVEVNVDEQSVRLNGVTNWLRYFDGDFWKVERGSNIINFSSDDNDPASYGQVSWRDTYSGA